MTKLLYLENTYFFESEAQILESGKDDHGHYVILDQTIFYPQGGGQPSDQGILVSLKGQLPILMVRNIQGEIRHYLSGLPAEDLKNLRVNCRLDEQRRILNAKYHTGSHLLGNVVEYLYPQLKAVKGHSFPKEAYVEFQGSDSLDRDRIQHSLHQALEAGHAISIFDIDPESFEKKFYKLPYTIPAHKDFRVMQIESFLPVPCGGTHLSSTREIHALSMNKIKIKDNKVHISYEVS